MTQQAAKIIDLERSYVPMDPNAFPATMHATGSEDAPEERIPVIPYDGYNFMPTAYGYRSFFGINSILDVDALTSEVDEIFVVQTPDFRNIAVALCDDGIWTKNAAVDGAWTQDITLTAPTVPEHKEWSKCVIANKVLMYRQGEASFWQMDEDNGWVPTAYTPDTLTMSAQQGIFKAGGRLGFWDSDGSIATSSTDDFTSFAPSLETGAGAWKFQMVRGRIVVIKQHGNGFIIYSTRSIVHVQRGSDAFQMWVSQTVFEGNGISYYNQVAQGQPDTKHFAYTTFGLVQIENGKGEYIIAEVFSYLKESRSPIALQLLEGRYLFFQLIEADYVTGTVDFDFTSIGDLAVTFEGGSYAISNPSEGACKAISAGNNFDSAYLFDNYAFTAYTDADGASEVPIWRDNLVTSITLAELAAWKAYKDAGNAGYDYFVNGGFTNGEVATLLGSVFFIPTKTPKLAASFSTSTHQEANTRDFFNKQEMLWALEEAYFDDWKEAIYRKAQPTAEEQAGSGVGFTDTPAGDYSLSVTYTKHTFGPYVMPTFFSEHNKYYGIADKSAWLQRSLTRGISIEVIAALQLDYTYPTAGWVSIPNVGTWSSYAALVAASASVASAYIAALDLSDPAGAPHALTGITENNATGDYAGLRNYRWSFENNVGSSSGTVTACVPGANYTTYGLAAGAEVYTKTERYIHTLSFPRFTYTDYPTCTYKELGYTDITGHGHYELDGSFVQDDSTPEAADYTDICNAVPDKSRDTQFGGFSIQNTAPVPCGLTDVTINSVEYSAPDETFIVPGTSFLLSDGSPAPYYPTYEGAFVYDLQLKKWGKMKQQHMCLVDWSPINSHAGDQSIPFDIFSVTAGCLLPDYTIANFDSAPEESLIRYGKIGYFRLGFTAAEEVRLHFREPAEGSVTIEGSLDGKNVAAAISKLETFSDTMTHTLRSNLAARWFNVVVQGNYDIKHLEFRGRKVGKR